MIKELRADERLALIELLCHLEIEKPEQRFSLLDGVEREVRNNIGDSNIPSAHISSIVSVLGDETFFELSDGSYPIMTVLHNVEV